MYSGEHFACKIIEVKSCIPERKIYSARDFRAKMEQEVKWVRQIRSSVGILFVYLPIQC